MSSDGEQKTARRYVIRGRVQGVGFRYFAEHTAKALGLSGWVKNLDDGNVEVYAAGNPEQLSELEAHLRKGPSWAEVRGVDVEEAALEAHREFRIRH
jgi:acylphosphatase